MIDGMKLILQIAAGVLLAKLVWFIGELIVAAIAVHTVEDSWKQSLRELNKPFPNQPSTPPTNLKIPPSPQLAEAPQLPRYPFPSNEVPVGAFACMNGVTVRHETNGWTQVSGSVGKPTCAK